MFGVLAMAHDVNGRRPVGQLLQEVCPLRPRNCCCRGWGLRASIAVGSNVEEGVHGTVKETVLKRLGQDGNSSRREEHAGGPQAVAQLLSSQVQGRAPPHRWLAGIARTRGPTARGKLPMRRRRCSA